MDCPDARTLISAAADGEATRAERMTLDDHLRTCPGCAAFAARIGDLDRAVRLRPAPALADISDAVLARVRPARRGWAQPALIWVAIVLTVQSTPALVLGSASGADPHQSRHLGAFGMALAVGLVYAALRPERAYGMLPFAAALVATTLASSLFDVIDGGSRALAEVAHFPELVGLTLLWWIAGSPLPGRGGRRRRLATR